MVKAVRQEEIIPGMKASDLVRYAMWLGVPDAVVIVMVSISVLVSNPEILHIYIKLNPQPITELSLQLESFYRCENLP